MSTRIELVVGDITTQEVDAIVNAANEGLRGGGGVDGAIHRAAGPELLQACSDLHPSGCPTGQARLTPGFGLPARFVIHAVGPQWHGGDQGEAAMLASCHRAALRIAAMRGFHSIAFPAISCGAYGYPPADAAEVALSTLLTGLTGHPSLATCRVVLFDRNLFGTWSAVLERLRDGAG